MPFPFNLSGPAFLLFYVAVAFVLLAVSHWLTIRSEMARTASELLPTDPYEIAFLRGGATEAIKVAVLSLVERRLVYWDAKDEYVQALPAAEATWLHHPIEREIVSLVEQPIPPDKLLEQPLLQIADDTLGTRLAAQGYLAAGAVEVLYARYFLVAWLLVTGLAGWRISAALAQGRTNVLMLLFLWVVASTVAFLLSWRSKPRAVLQHLRVLLEALRDRAPQIVPGRATNELALLAATFGFRAIPEKAAPYAAGIKRKIRSKDKSNGGGCGSGDGRGGCGGCGGGGGCGG